MYDSPEAATQETLTGWVSGGDDRRFWNKDEHMARWSGCTHIKCECGNIHKKMYTMCKECGAKKSLEAYLKKEFKEYDGSAVVTRDGDKYFFNEDDLRGYCEENEIEELELLFCEPNYYHTIDTDIWEGESPEDWDGELPKEMQEAFDKLNEVIKNNKEILSYAPGKIRTTYKYVTE